MDAVAAEPLPASQKFYTFNDGGRSVTIAVFWDPVWLAKKTAMIRSYRKSADFPRIIEAWKWSYAQIRTQELSGQGKFSL